MRNPSRRTLVGPPLARAPGWLFAAVALFFSAGGAYGCWAGPIWLAVVGFLFAAWTLLLGWLLRRRRG